MTVHQKILDFQSKAKPTSVLSTTFPASYDVVSDVGTLYECNNPTLDTMETLRRGIAAQILSVVTSSATMAAKRDGLRRIIVAGLEFEGGSTTLLAKLSAEGLAEFSKYTGASALTPRYLIKLVDYTAMVLIAASLYAPAVTSAVVASRLVSGGWAQTGAMFDADPDKMAVELCRRVGLQPGQPGNVQTIVQMCALWPAGPFSTGFGGAQHPGNVAAAAQAPTTTDIEPDPATASSTASVNSKGNNMTAATSTNPLANINAAVRPLLDNMLNAAGVGLTVDDISKRFDAQAALEVALADAEKAAAETITGLRQKLNAAANMPTSLAIPAGGGSIPGGTAKTVDAATVFPMLKGLTFNVPCFEWDHPHPHVPPVDDDYIFRKEMLVKALRCLARNENFWLQGHTGSGKTTFAEQIAARLGWPVARVAFDSNVDRSELVGRMNLTADGKGGTASNWLPGVLEMAISNGYILLCDELDAGHPNALYTLQPILEGKPLTLLEDGGRIVPRNPMARIVATGNTTGNGDPSGMYPACRILSAATLDRFPEFIHVPYMTLEEEKGLINRAVPSLNKKIVERLAKFGMEMRDAFTRLETPISYSPRRSIAFARAVEDFEAMGIKDEGVVFSLTFKSKLYDAAPEEFRQRITEIAKASFGKIDPTATLA
jgi:cobaltochelatase CobS